MFFLPCTLRGPWWPARSRLRSSKPPRAAKSNKGASSVATTWAVRLRRLWYCLFLVLGPNHMAVVTGTSTGQMGKPEQGEKMCTSWGEKVRSHPIRLTLVPTKRCTKAGKVLDLKKSWIAEKSPLMLFWPEGSHVIIKFSYGDNSSDLCPPGRSPAPTPCQPWSTFLWGPKSVWLGEIWLSTSVATADDLAIWKKIASRGPPLN